MKLLKSIKSRLGDRVKGIRSKRSLEQFSKDPDKDISQLIESIIGVRSSAGLNSEEISSLAIIDDIRSSYSKSDRSITKKDHGAGSPNSALTKEEMNAGVDVIEDLSKIYISSSSPDKWGKLLFKIIRDFSPEHCLELGTSVGISAAYQILALKLNHKGELITIEGSSEIAKIAEESLKSLGYEKYKVEVGRFDHILPKVLSKDKMIDLAFVDGHHDQIATMEYFELIFPFLNNRSIIIFDDINWSKGMRSAWKKLHKDPRIKFSVDLDKWGICLIDKDHKERDQKHCKVLY